MTNDPMCKPTESSSPMAEPSETDLISEIAQAMIDALDAAEPHALITNFPDECVRIDGIVDFRLLARVALTKAQTARARAKK